LEVLCLFIRLARSPPAQCSMTMYSWERRGEATNKGLLGMDRRDEVKVFNMQCGQERRDAVKGFDKQHSVASLPPTPVPISPWSRACQ
jgi:hypothetical protein